MRTSFTRPRLVGVTAYLVLLVPILAEKAGQTTSDTKASLLTAPGELLRSTFSLWNPAVSLGELQNQAYGYLFPMGPFFAGLQSLHVSPWLTERLWSWLLIVVAAEGARLVGRQLGLSAWPALIAGLAYGLNARIVSELGVRSAEVLPTAVIPWVLLPVLWVLRGRIGPKAGALFSAAAFLCVGAVNGTATIAPLPVVAVFVVWGCSRRVVGWSFLGWWSGLIAAVSLWWASSLVQLSAYSPPFFDYVEDARTTTSTAGFDPALRGASNWVGYLATGGVPSWPSAWALDYQPVLVAAAGLLAAVSVIGLATFPGDWRAPLVVSAALGLVLLTIAHTSEPWLQSPLAQTVQDSLDHPFALLRNIAKVDAVLRLPLAIGFGAAVSRLLDLARARTDRRRVVRHLATWGVVGACFLVAAGGEPVLAMNTRTPGWSQVPAYWTQAARYLEQQPGQNRAWVIPGTGFGIQTWGWTMDEPMSMVGRSPWITRSQVPLVPAETIRMLSSLEDVLDTGSGSAHLGDMLSRMGLGYVVLRHDLDPHLADAVSPNVVAIALARSRGIRRVATFGAIDLAPAIEVYEVVGRDQRERSDLRVLSAADARTVSSGPADVLAGVAAGVVDKGRAAVVAGDSGWSRPAQVLGDGYQLRERQFGRVHAAEGPVLAPGEPTRGLRRLLTNYPGSPGARPVFADYHGIRYVDASSSQGYADSFGPIRSEDAPFSAVDGDPKTGWTTAYLTRPLGQWLEVHYERPQTFRTVTLHTDADPSRSGVQAWRLMAGGRSVLAQVDPFTGVATARLPDVRGSTLRVSAARVGGGNRRGQVSIREIDAPGLPASRSLVVPQVPTSEPTAYLFGSRPESRACIPTLVAPDCDPNRYRPPEDAAGIDREVTFDRGGAWTLDATVVARSAPSASRLLDPFESRVVMHGSSTYLDDPTVSPRMAYDGTPTTSWIADPRDPTPTLTVDFDKPRRIRRLSIAAPAAPAVAPATASITANGKTRTVDLGGLGLFEPFVTHHLVITFANPTRRGNPLGVGDLRINAGRRTVVPLDGATPTGAVCGYGPNVFVDDQRYLTRVDGLMGDVSSSGPLSLSLCDGPLRISAGHHRIRIASTSEFQPVRAVIAELGSSWADETAPGSQRSLQVHEKSATSQIVDVGAGEEALLVTGRNWNDGWVASLRGKRLQPQRIDGWAQGWRVPAGKAGTIHIEYQPQRSYLVGLVGGLVVAGLLLLLAVVLLLRRRLLVATDPVTQAQVAAPRRRLARRRRARALLLVAVAYLAAGLPGLAGAAAASATWCPRRLRVLLAGALVAAGASLTAVTFLLHGKGVVPGTSDVVAGAGAVMGLVLGLVGDRDRAR